MISDVLYGSLIPSFPNRQEYAKPLLEKFKAWLDQSIAQVPPKSPVAQVINYAINHWPELTRYLEHGILEVDNSWCEN